MAKKRLLYRIFFYPAKLALHFYCRKVVINKKTILKEKGPILIAANHPNSFLDAVIIATLFNQPVYSLARGDVFKGKFFTKLLHSLNMLPVYRISEGSKNLGYNYNTFEECDKLFKQNKIVLIFSEGHCMNEWHLRPLKKGTARLAFAAWENDIPLKVLPLGINYSSFKLYGKNVHLNFGNYLTKKDFEVPVANGKSFAEFDIKLKTQLSELVYEIESDDSEKLKQQFYSNPSLAKKILLFVPAILGFLINAPLYYCIHLIIKNRAVDHYDSLMTGILFFIFPIYELAITLIVFFATKSVYSLLLLALLPFTLWSYLQLKRQIR